jgi:hypothetical protein
LPTKNIHHRDRESDKDSPQRHGEHREEEEEEEEETEIIRVFLASR